MAPYAEFQASVPCEYFEHTLSTETEVSCFTWKVVHCHNTAISAIEILDMNGLVVATAHTIGTSTLPLKSQVNDPLKALKHKPNNERSFLIRGISRDFAILKAMWTGFVKSHRNVRGKLVQLKLKLLKVGEGHYQKTSICANYTNPLIFQWEINGYFAYVDFKQSCIRLAKNIREVPENICISATIGMAFVLCRPRPPPPKDSNNLIAAYPPLPPTRPGVLNLDTMPFLVGSGLYASTLPRWYHATWWWRLWRW